MARGPAREPCRRDTHDSYGFIQNNVSVHVQRLCTTQSYPLTGFPKMRCMVKNGHQGPYFRFNHYCNDFVYIRRARHYCAALQEPVYESNGACKATELPLLKVYPVGIRCCAQFLQL